ncbi:MAG: hypothetical protein V2I82_11580 [Halieaceae bacterium]|jgi:hypothetical protein|nr:hypothetical protein [Halieaceae bacterium]
MLTQVAASAGVGASEAMAAAGVPPAENGSCGAAPPSASYDGFDFLAPREKAGIESGEPVRRIVFYRQNVFPDAEHLLAQAANRFNIITRESTLRAMLPFVAGDRVVDEQLEEAERILRRQRFLYDARVLVQARCDDGIDVAVIVRDVWTLTPNFGFSRSGGDNRTEFGITENNLLGLGKAVSLNFRSDRDRSGVQLSYFDPNIAGSRWTAALSAADNDDGEIFAASVERPFFALDARWATGISAFTETREQPLEFLNQTLYEIDADRQAAEIYFGRSRGRVGSWVDRYSAGFAVSDERYDFPLNFPGEQRVERRFAYPFARWERIEDRFVTRANVERVERTEDLSLGLRATARVGWSSGAFGGDDGDTLLYDAAASKRWYLSPLQLLGFQTSLSGRYAFDAGTNTNTGAVTEKGTQDLVARAAVDYLWRHDERFNFYARARFVGTHNLDPESQLTLGGDSDLRGYPSRYQVGDRSFLLTLEERYYSDWFPFGLFRVGYAAFVDVGRAWFADEAPAWVPARDGEHFDTLANVGLGLRLESVRTRRDRVLHIDLAHPLVDGPGVDSLQLTLSAKRSL